MASTNLTLSGIAELATRPHCNEPSEKMEKLEKDLQKARGKSKLISIIIGVKFESIFQQKGGILVWL